MYLHLNELFDTMHLLSTYMFLHILYVFMLYLYLKILYCNYICN